MDSRKCTTKLVEFQKEIEENTKHYWRISIRILCLQLRHSYFPSPKVSDQLLALTKYVMAFHKEYTKHLLKQAEEANTNIDELEKNVKVTEGQDAETTLIAHTDTLVEKACVDSKAKLQPLLSLVIHLSNNGKAVPQVLRMVEKMKLQD
ncbi:hypothetical protein L2E82_28544 [Cichorium intybus]|uniref:Uncharacterized protein n=1 Tax=Cichorium intybus TaxID=13427 RepID=A0ACB9CW36_CICIN|nr:hypothetical protein L2E82_28544 [Cichorium intybus]